MTIKKCTKFHQKILTTFRVISIVYPKRAPLKFNFYIFETMHKPEPKFFLFLKSCTIIYRYCEMCAMQLSASNKRVKNKPY